MIDDSHLLTPFGCEAVVEVLFSLEEPWQGSFVTLLADWSGNAAWSGGHEPDQTEIFDWLKIHPFRCRRLKQLLRAWTKDPRLFNNYKGVKTK